MIQPYYTSQKDYVLASRQKLKIIDVLNKAKHSTLMLSSKMPDYWQDFHGEIIQMELVNEIEELLKELKNESS
jgi:hypothetical protein